MDTAAGTVPGMIPSGRTMAGRVLLVSITDAHGITDGVEITITGTAHTTDGILTGWHIVAMGWVTASGMAADTGTTTCIRAPSLWLTAMKAADEESFMANVLRAVPALFLTAIM